MMLYRCYVPRAPLSAFVEDFWLYEDYTGVQAHERILPTGTFELVFNLREDALRIYGPSNVSFCRRYAGAVISGPYSAAFLTDADEETAIMGVHFKPGGAATVLAPPASAFADDHVDLETLWGPGAAELRERLCALRDPLARFRLLERVLEARLREPGRRRNAVSLALDALTRTHGRVTIREVARAVDLSPRRLTDLFAMEVGMTPKRFGRIQRFHNAVATSQQAGADWAQVAVECGYFDQSHLIRDFTAFSGLSPAAFDERWTRLNRAGAHVKRFHLPTSA